MAPTHFTTVSILSLEEEGEVDGAESRPIELEPAGAESEAVEEAGVEAEAVAAPAVEVVREEVEVDVSPMWHPKKRVKKKANQAPQPAATLKKAKG